VAVVFGGESMVTTTTSPLLPCSMCIDSGRPPAGSGALSGGCTPVWKVRSNARDPSGSGPLLSSPLSTPTTAGSVDTDSVAASCCDPGRVLSGPLPERRIAACTVQSLATPTDLGTAMISRVPAITVLVVATCAPPLLTTVLPSARSDTMVGSPLGGC